MFGAIREDDVPYDPGEIENNPQDETYGTFTRVLHHFYDPYHDRPLQINATNLGFTAPEWAIRGPADSQGRENSFSLTGAREAMWRALTLKLVPTAAGPLPDVAFAPSQALPTRESVRVAYWATLFRALGGAVHLLQDMAQPQHTRNDPHGGLFCLSNECRGGHKSYYEGYVDAMVKGANKFTLRERFFGTWGINDIDEIVVPAAPNYGGYPVPRFPGYGEYFSTAVLGASIQGKGLANYSNQAFYSAGTVVDLPTAYTFNSPPPNRTQLQTVTIPGGAVRNAAYELIKRGSLTLLSAPVADANHPLASEPMVALASRGAFDQFMRPGSVQSTLNHYNYAEQARLLLPRAVAYSAGLIDYFFRGVLEISLPEEGVYAVRDNHPAACASSCDFERLRMKLTNATPDETMGPGMLVAVVKFHRNLCYRSDLSGDPGGPDFSGNGCRKGEEEIVVSEARAVGALAAGGSQTLAFDFRSPKIPLNATDVSLQAVFRGKLGNEADAVVVTTRNIAEPNYIAFENATDYRYTPATDSYVPATVPSIFSGISVRFAGATQALATLAELRAPGHAQLAFLADKAALPARIDFSATQISVPGSLTWTMPPFEFYLPAGTGSTYTNTWPVNPMRGVLRRFVYSVSTTANNSFYLCAPAFNPLGCSESTLPPLTTANAVAWSVAQP